MQFFDTILDHYSWQGVTLIATLLLLFCIQFYHYAIRYNRISRFRLMRRKKRSAKNPPISVIVVVRGENEDFLNKQLHNILAQKYDLFEVVVVYVGGDIDYYGELQRVKEQHSNMRLTKVGANERLYITTKQALNIGIKSAQYDNLLFTTTEAMPVSDEWIKYIVYGFERGNIVLAPMLPHFEQSNMKSYIMRMTEFHRSRNAMAAAVSGRLYYAPRCNFGFTRDLYEATRGFDHLNIDSGENDLYLQRIATIATPKRISAVMARHAIVAEQRPATWSEWVETMRYNSITERYYPAKAKSTIRREVASRLLFFITAATTIAIMPLELKGVAAALLLLRYLVVLWSSRRTAHKLGESNICWRYWIFDIVGPFVEYIISLKHHDGKAKVWR